MDGNKENFSVTDQAQTVELNTAQFSVEEIS